MECMCVFLFCVTACLPPCFYLSIYLSNCLSSKTAISDNRAFILIVFYALKLSPSMKKKTPKMMKNRGVMTLDRRKIISIASSCRWRQHPHEEHRRQKHQLCGRHQWQHIRHRDIHRHDPQLGATEPHPRPAGSSHNTEGWHGACCCHRWGIQQLHRPGQHHTHRGEEHQQPQHPPATAPVPLLLGQWHGGAGDGWAG